MARPAFHARPTHTQAKCCSSMRLSSPTNRGDSAGVWLNGSRLSNSCFAAFIKSCTDTLTACRCASSCRLCWKLAVIVAALGLSTGTKLLVQQGLHCDACDRFRTSAPCQGKGAVAVHRHCANVESTPGQARTGLACKDLTYGLRNVTELELCQGTYKQFDVTGCGHS